MRRWLLYALILLCLMGPGIPNAAQGQTPPGQATATQSKPLEDYFVSFTPVIPFEPGSLDLFGYETQKAVSGWPILSPDRRQIVVTEVYFLPQTAQTLTRIYRLAVGKAPDPERLISPQRLNEIKTRQKQHPSETVQTQIKPEDVTDPHAFWDRYRPEKQPTHERQVLLEAGFGRLKPYGSDIVQVADWSRDGSKLLMVYRPGIHHLGIRRTIPVFYDFNANRLVELAGLPNMIHQSALKQPSALEISPDQVWDIRLLGWDKENPEAVLVKLVVFDGQSEMPAGFWSYDTQTGRIQNLGGQIPADRIARNGWLAKFIDPNAPEGGRTYGPGEAPPETHAPPVKPVRQSWGQRLQFWKKQR
jgi:hypothetical protein